MTPSACIDCDALPRHHGSRVHDGMTVGHPYPVVAPLRLCAPQQALFRLLLKTPLGVRAGMGDSQKILLPDQG